MNRIGSITEGPVTVCLGLQLHVQCMQIVGKVELRPPKKSPVSGHRARRRRPARQQNKDFFYFA